MAETHKERAKRIDRNVLRGGRWLEHGRILLAALALLVVIGWWSVGMFAHQANEWNFRQLPAALRASSA